MEDKWWQTLLKIGGGVAGAVTGQWWITAAIIAESAIQGGLGIYKASKGSKMEKQAISDRENYLGQMNTLIAGRQREHEKWKGYVEGGFPGGSSKGTIGKWTPSSPQASQQQQVSSYLDTLGSATKSPMGKKLMAKKFGLN